MATNEHYPGNKKQSRPLPRSLLRKHSDTPTYFTPSFSIRRHIAQEDAGKITELQKQVGQRLGKGFEVHKPENMTIKVIDQSKFIERLRAAGVRPRPEEMRDLAYNIRDGLTELLSNAPSPLAVPLGRLARFGAQKQALALQLAGWRGYGARYASHDESGQFTPHGAIVAENQLCIGAIAACFAQSDFVVDGLARTPHLTIARKKAGLSERDMQDVERQLDDVLYDYDEIQMGDPIIEIRTHPSQVKPETIYVRHAWASLAVS